jgi:hypothetical protein
MHERKKGAFRKGYKVNWSTDLFEITSVSEPEAENAQPQYMVKNLTTNRSWSKKLWGYQMQRVDKDALVKRPTPQRPALDEDEAGPDHNDAPPPPALPVEEKKRMPRERKAPAQGLQRAARHIETKQPLAADEFEVKRIVKQSKVGNRYQYLVEWTGYPDAKDYTWEPTKNLAKNVVETGDSRSTERICRGV